MTSSRLPSVLALAAVIIAVLTASAVASARPVRTLRVGWTFTISGQTGMRPGGPAHAVGAVVVRIRFGAGAWHVLRTTRTDARGRYHFTVTPRTRGLLTLLITPPDRYDQQFVLRVL